MKRIAAALCLLAGLIFSAPSYAALSVVQVASGSQLSGTGVPGAVVLGSPPTVGDVVVVFLHTDSGNNGSGVVPTLNTGPGGLPYGQLGNNFVYSTFATTTFVLYRYVQSGDLITLPVMATAGGCHWTYVAYEVSGVAGSMALDLQNVVGASFTSSDIYPPLFGSVPQNAGTLALFSGGNYTDTTAPTAPSGWSSDVSTGTETNWGSLGAWHYSTPAAGTSISGSVVHCASGMQVVLQTTMPSHPFVRQQFTNQQVPSTLNTPGVLQTDPVAGNTLVAFVGLSGFTAADYTISSNWTAFDSSLTGGGYYTIGMYREVQGGDTLSIPAFSTTSSTDTLTWGYSAYEIGGVTGTWAADFQSSKNGTTTGSSVTTTADTTLNDHTLALAGFNSPSAAGGSTFSASSPWNVDGVYQHNSSGTFAGISQQFASKGASVSSTVTFPASATLGWVQLLLGSAPSTCAHTLASMGAGC